MMMLKEDRRRQLDDIVMRMEQNQEPEENIRFVVDDFKSKYASEEGSEEPQALTSEPIKQVGATRSFGEDDALKNSLIDRIMTAIGPRSAGLSDTEQSGGDVDLKQKISAAITDLLSLPGRALASTPTLAPGGESFENAIKRIRAPEGVGGVHGFAEDVVRDPAMALSAGVGGLVKGGAKTVIGKIGTVAGRGLAEGAGSAVAHQLENVAQGEEVDLKDAALETGLSAGLSLATSAAGNLTKAVYNKIKSAPKGVSEKIVVSYLKPPAKAFNDGFDVENVAKHNLFGNVQEMIDKSDDKIAFLYGEIQGKLKQANAAGKTVDAANALVSAINDINSSKSRYGQLFLSESGVDSPLKVAAAKLAGMLDEVTNGIPDNVDMLEANKIKQVFGSLGSWAHGQKDLDLNAMEILANKTYMNLKAQIEQKSPVGVRELNKQISEILPIKFAAVRRLPVDQRNNVLSLGDIISTTGAIAAGNPAPLAVSLAERTLKNPKFAAVLSAMDNIGKAISKKTEVVTKPVKKVASKSGLPLRQGVRTALYRDNQNSSPLSELEME